MAAWTDDEVGLGAAWRELSRLFRRALARPLWTLGIALTLSALVVAREAKTARFYRSRVVFRVAAAEHTPNRALRELVQRDILTGETLLELMKRHRINPKLVEEKPLDAVEWLREDVLGLEVWRDGDAHLMLSFLHKDPKVAYELVCDLVELVAARTANPSVARANREVQRQEEQAAAAREALFAARSRLSLDEMALLGARPAARPPLVAEIESLRGQVAQKERLLAQLDDEIGAARERAQAARHQLSLRFEVTEPPKPAPLIGDPWRRLSRLGLVAFLLLLPLAAMAVGAYDPTVRDAADLERLGIRPLGHVPGFPGDQVGSLDEREKRMRYTVRQ